MDAATRKTNKKCGINARPAVNSGDKKKKNKKKKTEQKFNRKKMVKELDSLWSQLVHLEWGNVCAMGSHAGTAAHHFFGKKACSSLRWVVDNGVLLCFFCHIRKVHQQGLTEPARVALIKKIGQEGFDDLYRRAYQVVNHTPEDLVAIRDDLSRRLEIARGGPRRQ